MSTDLGLLILRLAAGGMMFVHGFGKLRNVLEGKLSFPNPIGVGSKTSLALAIFAELFCSLLVVLGLKTRLAAIPVVITMAVAAGVVLRGAPWGERELAVLFGAAFLALALCGGGRFGVDGMSGGRKRKK